MTETISELFSIAHVWIKAVHLIAVISWMAGLLYLPRLFVYHCSAQRGSDKSETFKLMERRLLRVIMNPAMVLSWLLGGALLSNYGDSFMAASWLHVKLLATIFLTVIHMMMARWRKDFEADRNVRSHKFYRTANEIPTLLMIAIVILVIVQPF